MKIINIMIFEKAINFVKSNPFETITSSATKNNEIQRLTEEKETL